MLKLLILLSLSTPLLATTDPLIEKYCLTDNGSVNPEAKTNVEKVSCSFGYKSVYFYESWMQKDPELTEEKIKNLKLKKLKTLEPSLQKDRLYAQAGAYVFRSKYREENPNLDPKCTFNMDKKLQFFMNCPGEEPKNLSSEFYTFMEKEDNQKAIFVGIYTNGKSNSENQENQEKQEKQENNDVDNTQPTRIIPTVVEPIKPKPISLLPVEGTKIELKGLTNLNPYTWMNFSPTPDVTFPVPSPVFKITDPVEEEKVDVPVVVEQKVQPVGNESKPEEKLAEDVNGDGVVSQDEAEEQLKEVEKEAPVQEVVETADAPTLEECKEALQQALAEILKDDTKNVIGMQYELTVLKMAVLAADSKGKTLESFIQSQAKAIQEADKDGKILNKVNETYKKYGLPEDQKALVDHLKQRVSEAEYYKKEKRFYNQESSAFLLAYQNLNPEAGFKDSDVSVLWYMDKVNQKAVANSKGNKYSAQSNLTNLSTRVARYTADIKGLKSESKESLLSLVNQQKKKIDKEMEAVLESFKQSNLACYNSLFGGAGADKECNMKVLDEQFSQLLAISSQIPSADLISLDESLKGNLTVSHKNKDLITKFKIDRVIKEEEPVERAPAAN